MYLKRMIALVVMFLLLLSIFSIAEESDTSTDTETQSISEPQTTSEANSCGFWCKISQFFFGSAENRAGKGWFDRKEALVGKVIETPSCASAGFNTFCRDFNKYYFKVSSNYWKNVKVNPLTLELEATGSKYYERGTPSSDTSSAGSLTVSAYVSAVQTVITKVTDEAVALSSAAQLIKVQNAIGENNLELAKTEAELADQNVVTANAKVKKANEIFSILTSLPGVTPEQIAESSLKVKYAQAGAELAAQNAEEIAKMVATSESKAEASPVHAAGPAEPSLPAEEPTAAGGTPAPKPASTFVYTSTVADDSGTLTVQGPKVLHKYIPVSEAKLEGKQVYQYSADGAAQSEWYVAEGEGLVRVVENEGKWKYSDDKNNPVENVKQAGKSTLIGDDVKITIKDGKISTAIPSKAQLPAAEAKPTAQPESKGPPKTYHSELGNVLGEGKIPGNIKDKYFDKTTGELKKGYAFPEKNTADQIDINTEGNKPILQITKKEDGVVSVKETLPPKEKDGEQTYTHTLLLNGQDFASQTSAQKEAGKATINGNTVLMKEDQFISDLDFTKQQLFYEDEEDKSNDVVKSALQVGDGKITYTDAGEETQTVTDTTNKQITELEGDWDSDDKKFTPSDGTIYEIDPKTGSKGKAKYLADYDYKDGKLDTVELFDPRTGDYLGDDTNPSDGISAPSIKPSQTTKTVLSSIYAAATSVKDYPAISKVLGISDWWNGVFKDVPFLNNFVTNADQTFAPMLGMNWFPSAICDSYWDLEPEGTAMIKTPTGTYQAVAHIEGERSAGKSPILCSRNPDQEAEQEWLCDDYQVCVENSFCYADEDQNNKPDDEEKQLTGYFYKITWGVSAPSDETFTPFIDENGVAVTFNVVIKNSNKAEPLYSKGADIDGPIELKNGDSDRDVILHYSPNLYTEVCIEWEHAPASIGEGFTGSFSGAEAIGDVCFDLVTSSVGEVNWEAGGKPSSTKASDPKVSLSTGW